MNVRTLHAVNATTLQPYYAHCASMDLIAWQKARLLSSQINVVTRDKAFQGDFDLKRQIRRSAGSVMDNIAEGFGRGSRGEFVQFLGIARGSLTEVKSQLYRSLDNEYISATQFDELYALCDDVNRLTDSLLLYLNNTSQKGRRYAKGENRDEP